MHAARLDWLDGLVDWFDGLPPADRAAPVPNCPGWTVDNVLAHVAYGTAIFWIGLVTDRAGARYSVDRAEAALGDGDGARLFAGVMRTLTMLLRSHDPADPCRVVIGPQTFGGLARLAATEVGIHQLDCEDALGRPRSMAPAHALDALAWTADTWWPGLVAGETDAPPPGAVVLGADPDGKVFTVGDGAEVARISGRALDVLAHAWGRPADVTVEGDDGVASWWSGLTARTTAVDTRT